jgi:hypothetical protein
MLHDNMLNIICVCYVLIVFVNITFKVFASLGVLCTECFVNVTLHDMFQGIRVSYVLNVFVKFSR